MTDHFNNKNDKNNKPIQPIQNAGFDSALNALEAFSEIGLTLAPANPDTYMCHIGAKIGGVDVKTAEKIYRFMIDAALDRHCQNDDWDIDFDGSISKFLK